MPEPKLPHPRKRLRSEHRFPQESSQALPKRQKLNHPRGSQPPAAFWDILSKIWLTERALKELDRRNTRSAPSSRSPPNRRFRRPATRLSVVKWKYKREYQPATDFLAHCSVGRLEEIKLLARHSGPNLSDLRGCRKSVDSFHHTISLSQSSSRGRKRDSTFSSNTKPTTNTTTAQIDGPYTSETTHQSSESYTDELARDVRPSAKRSSRSRYSRQRKRNAGASTCSTRWNSPAAEAQQSK